MQCYAKGGARDAAAPVPPAPGVLLFGRNGVAGAICITARYRAGDSRAGVRAGAEAQGK